MNAAAITILPFDGAHAASVRALFIRVNRLLAPDHLKENLEDYIQSSLAEEIDRIPAYYREHDGQFWVAEMDGNVVGMFGLERSGAHAMELRRMYVDPTYRRRGIASAMLRHAEQVCRDEGYYTLDLSTSEIQPDAVSLYRHAGYELVREVIADEASNKTIGGGIRRYHFKKDL